MTNTASGTVTSTTYTPTLGGTPGTNPSVKVTTGTKALVTVTGLLQPGQNESAYLSFAVSGATTQAATDARAVIRTAGGSKSTGFIQASTSTVITDLTAGENTFTLQYKESGGTVSFSNRTITVIPLG